MRITIVSAEYPPSRSGEAANTFFLAHRLSTLGIDVSVVTREQPVSDRQGKVTVLPAIRRWNWSGAKALTDCIGQTNPDAILLMYLGAMFDFHPMITYLPQFLKDYGSKAPLVTRFENPLSHAEPFRQTLPSRIFWKLRKTRDSTPEYGQLLRRSDAIITLCNYHRSLLLHADPASGNKMYVVPPPCNIRFEEDDGRWRQAGRRGLGARDDEILVGYIGYVYANKGFDTLLHSLSELKASGRPLRLVVLGGSVDLIGDGAGYLERMQELARELRVADLVDWTGAFEPDSDKIVELMHAVDVFALPFDNGVHLNNSSVSSVLTYGKPLVTTRSEHADLEIGAAGAADLVEPKSPGDLSRAIAELASNESRRVEMAEAARAFAASHFSWESCIDATLHSLGVSGDESIRGNQLRNWDLPG